MKKNTFYLVVGCIALALLAIFWYSVEVHIRFLVEIAFIVAIVIIYLIRKKVTDIIEDERTAKIRNRQPSGHSRSSGWSSVPSPSGRSCRSCMSPHFPGNIFRSARLRLPGPRMMGYFQLGLLCLMIFLYVGFRIYYARKYGEWETDEE